MEDYDIVSIEMELDRLRDEREQKEKSDSKLTPIAPKSKLGCGTMLLYFILGIVLFQIVGGLLSAFSK
jgi:hypothetical protein